MYYFMSIKTAPRDGTKVLLIKNNLDLAIANFESESFEGEEDIIHYIGWCNDFGMNYESDSEFLGWFPIPKIHEELIKAPEGD